MTDTARAVWEKQLEDFNRAVSPWVVTYDDWQGISVACPPALSRAYGQHLAVGYAKGWI